VSVCAGNNNTNHALQDLDQHYRTCLRTPEVEQAEWMGLVVGYLQIIARLLRDILARLEER
jgi:hypothetical protein